MILPIEPEPIENWKDALIRIGIPWGVLALVVYFLLPEALKELTR